MLKNERIEQVLELLKSRKFCTVDELVNELHYSPATIRRDLTQLAQRGLVEKSYGGASFIGTWTLAVREHQYTAEKARLCLAASALIHDGDTVFVDGTTTTYFLRDVFLKKQHLTLVTTNLKLALDLGEDNVTCFLPGGRLCDTAMLGGPLVAETLQRFSFDVSFISPKRITREGDFEMSEVFWNSTATVLKNSQKSVCLFHKEKFDSKKICRFGRLDIFDAVISDAEFPEEFATDFPDTEFILVKYIYAKKYPLTRCI